MTELHVDASAIVGILLREDDWEALLDQLAEFNDKTTSVVSAFESVMAFGRATGRRADALDVVQNFLANGGIRIVSDDAGLLENLADAHVRFGKGSKNPAKLNLGDCFSYAFAKRDAVPLLYKGDDFSKTDLA